MVKEIKAVFLGFCIQDKKELLPQGEKFRIWLLSLLKDLCKQTANSQIRYLFSPLNTP